MAGACFCGYDAAGGLDDNSIFLVVGMPWPYSVCKPLIPRQQCCEYVLVMSMCICPLNCIINMSDCYCLVSVLVFIL